MKHIKRDFRSKSWVQPPGWTQGVGPNPTFSEYGHVAYQIKWNRECSNMVANILPHSTPPPNLPGGVIFFSEHGHVAYQIKGNHVCSNMVANILSPYSPLG